MMVSDKRWIMPMLSGLRMVMERVVMRRLSRNGKRINPGLLALFLPLFFSGYLFATPAAVGPSYVDLEPSFTLNYGGAERIRYLQASITLRVRDQAAALEVTAHSDAIRHTIIMLFARQPEEKIRTAAGRDDILEQALRELQDLMMKETGESLVDRVLFTSFVLQT